MSWNHVKLGGINESVRETGYDRELSNGMNARVEMHHIHDRYVLKVADHAVFLAGDVLGSLDQADDYLERFGFLPKLAKPAKGKVEPPPADPPAEAPA